jgi:hypothetical protein
MAIGGLVIAVAGVYNIVKISAWRKRGQLFMGKIVGFDEKEVSSAHRNYTQKYPIIEFKSGNETLTKRTSKIIAGAQIGDGVQIYYRTDKPQEAVVTQGKKDYRSPILSIVAGLLLSAAVVLRLLSEAGILLLLFR